MTDIIGGSFLGGAWIVPEYAQQALLEACYIEADRIAGIANSPHREFFNEAVFSAIRQDKTIESSETLGYICDPSTSSGDISMFRRNNSVVTHNGNTY